MHFLKTDSKQGSFTGYQSLPLGQTVFYLLMAEGSQQGGEENEL